MSNMSYCRFQNTVRYLIDCEEALREVFDGSAEPLSVDEVRAAQRLVRVALDIVMSVAEEAGVELEDLDGSESDKKLIEAIVSANLRCHSEEVEP